MSDVVGKLWGFCHTLRHDGVDYGDYIEQLTYLLFLKMAEEKGVDIPKEYSWSVLREKSGTELTDFYVDHTKSTNDKTLIDIATTSLKRSSPFQPFPKGLSSPEVSFKVVISFKEKS